MFCITLPYLFFISYPETFFQLLLVHVSARYVCRIDYFLRPLDDAFGSLISHGGTCGSVCAQFVAFHIFATLLVVTCHVITFILMERMACDCVAWYL